MKETVKEEFHIQAGNSAEVELRPHGSDFCSKVLEFA